MKYTWLELIRYILGFISNRNKAKDSNRIAKDKKVNDHLGQEYDKIDKKKAKQKKKNVKKRLDNMF
jgi:hypothetical protein